ncbi:hypothetical protein Holit_01921 [Hollandina sp. SP2]
MGNTAEKDDGKQRHLFVTVLWTRPMIVRLLTVLSDAGSVFRSLTGIIGGEHHDLHLTLRKKNGTICGQKENGQTVEPFPKPSGSDNKILNHPQGSQAEDSTE